MANKYLQITNPGSETHFAASVAGEIDMSRMDAVPEHYTTFNAGNIVPIYCAEVLPHDTFSFDLDFVIRQTTLLAPTMGNMVVDIYAFEVPNRIVNQSWKTIMGENPNGSWTATPITSAPLVDASNSNSSVVKIPVQSLADYYGFPTQGNINVNVLGLCNDWKFRGYLEIYNNFFRDQNYQPPIPYSKLNVFQNFFHTARTSTPVNSHFSPSDEQDNSVGGGAIGQALYGNLTPSVDATMAYAANSAFNALDPPLKANKLHDYFTSVLPTPQKGAQVFMPVNLFGTDLSTVGLPVITGDVNNFNNSSTPFLFGIVDSPEPVSGQFTVGIKDGDFVHASESSTNAQVGGEQLVPINLFAQLNDGSGNSYVKGELSVSDLRLAASISQVYEQLARSGSRYREMVRSFFALDVDDPYKDIPFYLGHIRRNLELYQTAQTSSSVDGGTPQGNLAAFGYTASSGHLFTKTFLEHGYVHVFAVVRHKNIYSSFMDRSNFRLSMLDYYLPQLANLSDQPVYCREINPFALGAVPNSQPIGYQEAWAEYRFEPNRVSGYMRPGVDGSLALWNYADEVNSNFSIVTGDWLKSNSEEVLNRSLAVKSDIAPQFKAQFVFHVDKTRPMPTYSVPGLDIV